MSNLTNQSFWDKATTYAKKMGQKVLEPAMVLWYLWESDETPAWAKALIMSALVYFISPVDAIPDVLPGGYADDLAVMMALLAKLDYLVDEGTKGKARAKAQDLLS